MLAERILALRAAKRLQGRREPSVILFVLLMLISYSESPTAPRQETRPYNMFAQRSGYIALPISAITALVDIVL